MRLFTAAKPFRAANDPISMWIVPPGNEGARLRLSPNRAPPLPSAVFDSKAPAFVSSLLPRRSSVIWSNPPAGHLRLTFMAHAGESLVGGIIKKLFDGAPFRGVVAGFDAKDGGRPLNRRRFKG